ncbi:hypothetical protein [Hydrogenibacillus sp. N12]|uniref:hypothetical protein n=1 Tax=Hydrogenibacillus sp. N12 TaxID=2866627 RepID=UPI001C7E108A|nr:hypothetical protein [Hydrogenibacillus sp. N12]QZA34345.1 hypothetical protein K2M58_05945 [Hydrogenibacillus sp. N12]
MKKIVVIGDRVRFFRIDGGLVFAERPPRPGESDDDHPGGAVYLPAVLVWGGAFATGRK